MDSREAENFVEYINSAFARNDDRPALGFPERKDSYNGFKTWSPRELGMLADRAAAHYSAFGIKARRQGEPALLIAILAPADIEWAATFFAITRMGHAALLLSNRLPDDTVAALLKKANCRTIIHERNLQLGMTVIAIPVISSERLAEEVEPAPHLVCDPSIIDPKVDLCHISHSSGSTGVPKLFPMTHEDTIIRVTRPNIFLKNAKVAYVASALYNAFGLRMLMLCLVRGSPVYYDNDRLPFTTAGILSVIKEIRPQYAIFTPHSLGLTCSKAEGVELLKQCERVSCFGAVCPQALGDKLVEAGVQFESTHGMSEVAPLLTSANRPTGDNDWEWLLPYPFLDGHCEFRSAGTSEAEAMYELIILPTFHGLAPKFANCNNPPGSFATGDLFLKHPTKPNRWKIIGRKDDQLKIYQGDRQSIVNALVYEDRIKQGNEDMVDEVLVFGQGRSKLGLLVFARDTEGQAKDTVVERVWASIRQEINGKLQTGIDKDMILVVASDAALPRTGKLNFIRPQVYLKYKHLIDAAYDQGSEGAEGVMNGSADGSAGSHASRKSQVESTPTLVQSAFMAVDNLVAT